MNIPEVLQNNMTILDQHTRREARPGLWMLAFPGVHMPDGHDVEWQVKGQVKHQDLNEFCDIVRRTWYERIGSQTPPESESDNTRDTGSEGGDPEPRVTARAVVPEAPPLSAVEETLEDVLKSQVSRIGDRLYDVEDRITGLGSERQELVKELIKCKAALLAYEGKTQTLEVIAPKKPAAKKKRKTKAKPNPASGAKALTKERLNPRTGKSYETTEERSE